MKVTILCAFYHHWLLLFLAGLLNLHRQLQLAAAETEVVDIPVLVDKLNFLGRDRRTFGHTFGPTTLAQANVSRDHHALTEGESLIGLAIDS